MDCNKCGVCCTEISISSSIPVHHEGGKPAGVRCGWLSSDGLCGLFSRDERPAVCSSFEASQEICGSSAADAVSLIRWWEQHTINQLEV